MTEFNPEKYGFKKNIDMADDLYVYETKDFSLAFRVFDGHLTVYDTCGSKITEGKVPANNQSLALMLKAFGIQRPKT